MVEVLDQIVNDMVAEIGGSISAEHGIGAIKVTELEHYRSPVELDIMRAIKKALDPRAPDEPWQGRSASTRARRRWSAARFIRVLGRLGRARLLQLLKKPVQIRARIGTGVDLNSRIDSVHKL